MKKNIEYIFVLTLSVFRDTCFVIRISLHGLIMAFIVGHGFVYAYEVNSTVPVANLLVPELAQSIHHRVEDIKLKGKFYDFRIDSDFGLYNVTSIALLKIRVEEIITLGHAINQLRKENEKTPDELTGQLHISADSALDIITRPVSTASNLAGQLVSNLNDTLTGVPVTQEQSELRYGEVFRDDPVTAMHKRNIAFQWRLDVYSTNPKVQEFLNTVAKSRASGKITAGTPSFNRRAIKPAKIVNHELDIEISYLLKTKNKAELIQINNIWLTEINVREDAREKFLQHKIYTSSHNTRITQYLMLLEGVKNRSAFIEAAISIGDETMAFAFEQGAMMLAYYHKNITKLQKLHAGKDMLQAITQDNKLLYFAPVDVIYWSKRTEYLFDSLTERASSSGFREWELIIAGTLTAEARSQLIQRKYSLHEKFYD